jgi:SAM-dependent methyltransferase
MTVEAYFHSRADQFDSLYAPQPRWQRIWNHCFRAGLYQRASLAAAEICALGNCTVLDVGCGSGRNSVLFAEAGARRVLGVDVAPAMICLAKRLSAESPLAAKLEFLEADFFRAGFREQFDVCVALGFFDYVRDPVTALRRMAELSRQKVIASFPARSPLRAPLRKLRYALRRCPVYFYSRRQLETALLAAGLPNYKIVPYASSGLLLVAEAASKRIMRSAV